MTQSNQVRQKPKGFFLKMVKFLHDNLLGAISGLALVLFIFWLAHQDFSEIASIGRVWITGGVILALFLHLVGIGLILGFFRKTIRAGSNYAHHHGHNIVELETRGDKFRLAGAYDWMAKVITLGRENNMRQNIIDLVELNPGDVVLDTGCGTGTLLMAAERRLKSVGRFEGIDAAHEMTTKAQQKADKAGLKARFRPGLIEDIDFEDNRFDVAMNTLVMHHLPDEEKEKGIHEMYRVLKPNGEILIVDIEASNGGIFQRSMDFAILLHGGPERNKNKIQALLPMLESAGFKEIELGKVNRQMGFVKGKKLI